MFAILRRRGLIVPPKYGILVGKQNFDPQIAVLVKSFSSKKSSPDVCKNDPKRSLTVSYLINSCGLSSEVALVVSKKLQIKSRARSDEVLELLRKYGFTNAHIPRLVTRWPFVLGASPRNNLLPKLEFFRSIGVPLTVLAQNLSLYPLVLQRSLECYLIPCYNFLKGLVKSDERVAYVFSRVPRAFAHGWEREITTNIAILRERGLPESSIAFLLTSHPTMLIHGKEKLTGCVDRATEMGFDATKPSFPFALLVFGDLSESTLKHKMDVYRRCGWSESEINAAFLKHPFCMKLSEKKIMANMEFLVNYVGLKPVAVAKYPVLLGLSLEKRIKPRCWVVGILNAKGLLKKKLSMSAFLLLSEVLFLKRYIVNHQDDIPQLLDVYQGKLSLLETGFSQEVIEKSFFQFQTG